MPLKTAASSRLIPKASNPFFFLKIKINVYFIAFATKKIRKRIKCSVKEKEQEGGDDEASNFV